VARFWFLTSMIVCLLLFAAQSRSQAEDAFGAFQGDLIVKLKDDGRTVELVEPFAFKDEAGKTWSVPAGALVDGASIPQAFWSVIGGPFEGKYREASVIHDYYCDRHADTWQNVHLVFYNGMRANGVGALTAKIMYAAVYNFGPRWIEVNAASGAAIAGQPLLREEVKEAIVKNITENDPSIEEIQRISDQLSQIKDVDELEKILSEHAQCTPIVDNNIKKTLVLCDMSSQSKKLAAQKGLQNLAGQLNSLLTAQTIFFLPAVQSYANDPTPEKWDTVQKHLQDVYRLVKVAARTTVDVGETNNPAVAEHANAIFGILSERSVMLSQLQARPHSRDELMTWNSVYGGLVRKLASELTALQTVISQQPQ
jgi:Protein of unknown function (DUF1353)